MKKIKMFALLTCLVLVATIFVAMESRAASGLGNPVFTYNPNQRISGIRALGIGGKTYNIEFIYGNLDKAFSGPEGLELAFTKTPNAEVAIKTINEALNNLNPIPRSYPIYPKNLRNLIQRIHLMILGGVALL